MSALVVCDGPNCGLTRNPDVDLHGWLHLEHDGYMGQQATYDFHSWGCLAAFAAAQRKEP